MPRWGQSGPGRGRALWGRLGRRSGAVRAGSGVAGEGLGATPFLADQYATFFTVVAAKVVKVANPVLERHPLLRLLHLRRGGSPKTSGRSGRRPAGGRLARDEEGAS